MGKYIPQATLHREIHAKIHDVPTPNGAECRMAYNEIVRLEKIGAIDIVNDSVEKRLSSVEMATRRSRKVLCGWSMTARFLIPTPVAIRIRHNIAFVL